MSRNLKKTYYKSQSSRTEGLGSRGWWFTGGKSFMSNGYVIYYNGLGDDLPNPTAVSQGQTYIYRLFDQRSLDKRSSYAQFTSQLAKIAKQAADNEQKHLTLKLQELEKSDIDVNWLDKIRQAIEEKDYSAAYTLLYRRDQELEKFQKEIESNKNKSFSKTNEFFNSQFFMFVAEKFREQIESQKNKNSLEFGLDTDFENLVDEYLEKITLNSVNNNKSLESIRQTFIDGLEKIAKENGGQIKVKADLAKRVHVKSPNAKLKRKDLITKKGNFRTPGVIAETAAKAILNGLGYGLSEEALTVGIQSKMGTTAFSTGTITKEIIKQLSGERAKVYQKADSIGFDIFEANFSARDVIDKVYSEGLDESQKEFYERIEQILKEEALKNSSGEFFKIATNIKGYISNFDLEIEGTGNFLQRTSTLKQLKLDGGMVDKLIFMLNNTTKKCIMENRIEEIEDYLAAVCVAWMWDNPEEIFDLNLQLPNYHTIYLFNSGGAYFTASQIIQQTLNRLLDREENANNFVRVNITPPKEYTSADYKNLVKKYSVNSVKSQEEWQSVLQKRWDEVKDDALKSGALSIHFNQKELNELLGNLKEILKQN